MLPQQRNLPDVVVLGRQNIDEGGTSLDDNKKSMQIRTLCPALFFVIISLNSVNQHNIL
jgi:hypothetical protein